MNFGRTRLNESDFLLPSSGLFELATVRAEEARNSFSFSGCREFRAESAVRFEAPGSMPHAAGMSSEQEMPVLPDSLPFRIMFTQDVAFRTVAAGDTIAAKLATPIADAAGHVLVPSGAPVIARVLDADLFRVPRGVSGGHLIFRPESIRVGGTLRPLVATTAESIWDCGAAPEDWYFGDSSNVRGWISDRNVGPLLLSPNTAIWEFCHVRPEFVLKAGKRSKWKTGGSGPTPGCLLGTSGC